MLNFLLWLLINALGVYVTAALLPGVRLKGFGSAMLVALILAVVNALIRPVLVILTLPLTILTLGLFLLVINAKEPLARFWRGRDGGIARAGQGARSVV